MLTTYNQQPESYQLVHEPDEAGSYSYADYLEWKFSERIELIRGRIFRTKTSNSLVQRAYARIVTQLYTGLSNTNCNVFHAPFDVRLPVKNYLNDSDITTVVHPDICAIVNGSIIDGRGCYGVPNMVIEILSPGSSLQEVQPKFELYQEAGVPEYWVIDPAERNVTVYVMNEEGRFNEGRQYAGKELIRSKAISTFVILVTDIFK